MNTKKVELLAPAGDYSCFMAAINAGADAVYLGGSKFGARAYANNFTEEEIIDALHYAHLFGKKIYLTVNTLVKESEINELIPYIRPLYDEGLDGVIIQDLGVFTILQENFPGLELHASTQMTIAGLYSAEFMKKMGACRIVPARELSLDEIKEIKERTGLEIECFIHGAMCYAYSGQCLFSSILGGRSGNRGRCAGPCRLPYSTQNNQKSYPLSLKDMYTLDIIPELIEAGIDSFKIEGRMKSPEYVAGVTSMYRKYIDRYLDNPSRPYIVDKKDEEILRGLYIRSDICQGYYKQHNSKSMVTLGEPGYKGCSEKVIEDIRKKYLCFNRTLPVNGVCNIFVGQKMSLTLKYEDISICVTGEEASRANNQPLDVEGISSRLSKLGDTHFTMDSLEVYTDNESFVPVKQLNELRRKACEKLQKEIISNNFKREDIENDRCVNGYRSCLKHSENENMFVSVSTAQQLKVALKHENVKSIYASADIPNLMDIVSGYDKNLFLSLPHILRKRSYKYLDRYRECLESGLFLGVLIRNLEELEWLTSIKYKGVYIADYTVYSWNKQSDRVLSDLFSRTTVPIELNKREMGQLGNEISKEIVLYGRLPLMYSANCVQNTLKKCLGYNENQNIFTLTDRYRNDFPIVQNCVHCYNILYNSVPMSLHGQYDYIKNRGYQVYRIEFSIESADETKSIIDYFSKLIHDDLETKFPVKDYTNGHYKRGVE